VQPKLLSQSPRFTRTVWEVYGYLRVEGSLFETSVDRMWSVQIPPARPNPSTRRLIAGRLSRFPAVSPDTMISTWRFRRRPLAVSLEAIGIVFPSSRADTPRSGIPCCAKYERTASVRAVTDIYYLRA
jgi:hypothetical protein